MFYNPLFCANGVFDLVVCLKNLLQIKLEFNLWTASQTVYLVVCLKNLFQIKLEFNLWTASQTVYLSSPQVSLFFFLFF